MGKFRAKPTRSVAKPFKKNNKATTTLTLTNVIIPTVATATLDSSSKICKRPKSRASALKKKTNSATLLESNSLSPKKSVTFASPSSNTIHVFGSGKSKKESIRQILKDGAGALVNLVSGGVQNFKRKGLSKSNPAHTNVEDRKGSAAGETSSNSLNKVLRNQFKDKKTRRKLRKDAFHKKLSLMKEEEQEIKAEKRRKATLIVGDMLPIAKILEELEQEVKVKAANKEALVKQSVPKKKKLSLKKREQEMLDALKFFEATGL